MDFVSFLILLVISVVVSAILHYDFKCWLDHVHASGQGAEKEGGFDGSTGAFLASFGGFSLVGARAIACQEVDVGLGTSQLLTPLGTSQIYD